MKKTKAFVRILLAVAAALLIFGVITYRPKSIRKEITLEVTLSSEQALGCRVYYLKPGDADGAFNESESASGSYSGSGKMETVEITIPCDASVIRFDPAGTECDVLVSGVRVTYDGQELRKYSLEDDVEKSSELVISKDGNNHLLSLTGDDGYMVFDALDPEKTAAEVERIDEAEASRPLTAREIAGRAVISVIVALIFLLLIVRLDKIMAIPREVAGNAKLVLALGKNDFRTKFAGSFFGTFWAFVQPIVTILVYWFVFQRALNVGSQATKGGIAVPYVLWLLSGLVPWFFFSDSLSSGSNALIEYTYLVKKVVFQVSCLPVVKVISSLYVHLFFIAFTILMYGLYGMFPGWFCLQLFYYSAALLINVTALVYFTSSIVAFFRDMSQIVNIGLQVGVWFTPIMWNIDTMSVSGPLLVILKANPLYYIVMGYRDSLINHVWFWQRPAITLYYWLFTIVLFLIGTHVFRRLQPHFADVL